MFDINSCKLDNDFFAILDNGSSVVLSFLVLLDDSTILSINGVHSGLPHLTLRNSSLIGIPSICIIIYIIDDSYNGFSNSSNSHEQI